MAGSFAAGLVPSGRLWKPSLSREDMPSMGAMLSAKVWSGATSASFSSIAWAISSTSGWRPVFRYSSSTTRLYLERLSVMYTGMRTVRPWLDRDRVTAWRIHQVA
jgi:hypothetical protein